MCCNGELFTDDEGIPSPPRSLALDSLIRYNREDAWNTASGWFRRESLTARVPNWRIRYVKGCTAV